MHRKEHSMYRDQYNLQVQASAEGLGTYSPQMRGTIVIQREASAGGS